MSTQAAPEPPHHSADRVWWWDGVGWLPAYRGNRDSWFDGYEWRLLTTRSVRFVSRVGVCLFAVGFLGLYALYPMVADAHRTSTRVELYADSIMGALAMGAVLAALRPIQRHLRMRRCTNARASALKVQVP